MAPRKTSVAAAKKKSPTKRSSPSAKQPSPSQRSNTLDKYFSPSPAKKKRHVLLGSRENIINGTAAAKGKKLNQPTATTLVLLKIKNIAHAFSKSAVTPDQDGVYEVSKGTVIGRSVGGAAAAKNKIDLGIKGSNTGVSKLQLKVMSADHASIKIKQMPEVTNTISYCMYNEVSKSMSKRTQTLGKGQTLKLKAGDVVIMDGMRKIPDFFYRVVKCQTKKRAFTETIVLPEKQETAAKKSLPETSIVNLVAEDQPPKKRTKSVGKGKDRLSSDSSKTIVIEPDAHEGGDKACAPTLKSTKKSEVQMSTPPPSSQDNAAPSLPAKSKDAKVPALSDESDECFATDSPVETLSVSNAQTTKPSMSPVIELDNGEQTELLNSRVPKVGDRFRALYKIKTCTFVEAGYGSWWAGTAEKVTPQKSKKNSPPTFKVSIKFSDTSTHDFVLPDKEVQLLEDDSRHTFAHVPIDGGGFAKEYAFDRDPQELFPGDLVDALYQNGVEDGKWFRGRVAQSDGKTCTICYDDGDVERGVPFGRQKIILVDRGSNDMAWLAGFRIYDDYRKKSTRRSAAKKSKKKAIAKRKVIGQVTGHMINEESGAITATISFSGGKSETISYSDLVQYIFQSYIASAPSTLTWPTAQPSPDTSSYPLGTENTRVGKKKSKAKRKPSKAAKEAFRADEWDLSASRSDVVEVEEHKGMKDLPPALANGFLRALNSSEPHIGHEAAVLTAMSHDKALSQSFGKGIQNLMFEGPKSEGVAFPDPNRVELALQFVDFLASSDDGEQNLIRNCCPREWPVVQEFIDAALKLRYAEDGDHSTMDKVALERVADSLHLSALNVEFFATLCEAELGEQIDQKKPDRDVCRSSRLADAIWNCPSGARHAVKVFAQAYCRAWMKFGPYAVCDLNLVSSDEHGPSHFLAQRLQREASRLLHRFGRIVSYVLFLYSIVDGVKMEIKELAFLMMEAFNLEKTSSTVNPVVFLPSKKVPNTFWQTIMLRIVLNMDQDIVEPVRRNLAKLFKVEKEYKMLFD